MVLSENACFSVCEVVCISEQKHLNFIVMTHHVTCSFCFQLSCDNLIGYFSDYQSYWHHPYFSYSLAMYLKSHLFAQVKNVYALKFIMNSSEQTVEVLC